MSGDTIKEARLALRCRAQAVAQYRAEGLLKGKHATRDSFQIVPKAFMRDCQGLSHTRSKSSGKTAPSCAP